MYQRGKFKDGSTAKISIIVVINFAYGTIFFDSYRCDCEEGYTKNDFGVCEDIDECAAGTDICNETISHCENSFGTYFCMCNSGYER